MGMGNWPSLMYIIFDAECQAGPECHFAPTLLSLVWSTQRESDLARQGSNARAQQAFALARASYLLAQTIDPAEPQSTSRRQELLDRAMELLDGLRAEGDPFAGVSALHANVVAARRVRTD